MLFTNSVIIVYVLDGEFDRFMYKEKLLQCCRSLNRSECDNSVLDTVTISAHVIVYNSTNLHAEFLLSHAFGVFFHALFCLLSPGISLLS